MNAALATLPPRAIRAILVDDESSLREHLRERLEQHPEIVIVGEADNVQSAVELVTATRPEVIFLDVQMPPDNGFDLLPLLEHIDPLPAVVFVTAFERYALRAFEVHAMDYLTKPVHPDRLAQTVARLQRVLSQPGAGAAASPALGPPLVPETPLEAADMVRLQDGRYLRFVEASRIAVARSQGDSRISRGLLVNCTQIQQVSRLDREKAQVFFFGIAEPLTLSRLEFRRLRSLL
jgi:two-component system LytT family response regulator